MKNTFLKKLCYNCNSEVAVSPPELGTVRGLPHSSGDHLIYSLMDHISSREPLKLFPFSGFDGAPPLSFPVVFKTNRHFLTFPPKTEPEKETQKVSASRSRVAQNLLVKGVTTGRRDSLIFQPARRKLCKTQF